MNKVILILIAVGVVSGFFSGCSSDDKSKNNVDVKIGRFIDSPVEGLRYTTASLNGITSDEGEFFYRDGETVIFYIGDILLPVTTAGVIVTPYTISGVIDTENISLINITRLLQTLDTDGSPSNGITISDQAHEAASGITINFDSPTFDNDIESVVSNSGSVNTSLVTETVAMAHLEESVKVDIEGMWTISVDENFSLNEPTIFENISTYRISTNGNSYTVVDLCSNEVIDGVATVTGNLINIVLTVDGEDGTGTVNFVGAITNKDIFGSMEDTFGVKGVWGGSKVEDITCKDNGSGDDGAFSVRVSGDYSIFNSGGGGFYDPWISGQTEICASGGQDPTVCLYTDIDFINEFSGAPSSLELNSGNGLTRAVVRFKNGQSYSNTLTDDPEWTVNFTKNNDNTVNITGISGYLELSENPGNGSLTLELLTGNNWPRRVSE